MGRLHVSRRIEPSAAIDECYECKWSCCWCVLFLGQRWRTLSQLSWRGQHGRDVLRFWLFGCPRGGDSRLTAIFQCPLASPRGTSSHGVNRYCVYNERTGILHKSKLLCFNC